MVQRVDAVLPGAVQDLFAIVDKCSSYMATSQATIASLRDQLRQKDAEIDQLTPHPRKKVKKDEANKLFVTRKEIQEAQKGLNTAQAKLVQKRK